MTHITPTSLEKILVDALCKEGIDFVFQYPVRTGFVLDFAWPDIKLAVEVDGPYHKLKKRRRADAFRDYMLKRGGWTILRFDVEMITEHIDEVIKIIKKKLTR